MNPIYERQPSGGIGYGFEDFLNHFFEICYEHLREGRAKAFAFVLFNFEHGDIFNTMKDNDVFTKLDRSSGKELTIFYLNSKEKNLINNFNNIFANALSGEGEIPMPSITFFKVIGNDAEGIESHRINDNKFFAFQEIDNCIQDYIKRLNNHTSNQTNFFESVFKKLKDAGLDYLIEKSFDKLMGG